MDEIGEEMKAGSGVARGASCTTSTFVIGVERLHSPTIGSSLSVALLDVLDDFISDNLL